MPIARKALNQKMFRLPEFRVFFIYELIAHANLTIPFLCQQGMTFDPNLT